MNRFINIFAFAILAVLWFAILAALVVNPALLESAWQTFRSWPLIFQLVVGLLTLPVVAGLWVWHTSWPMLARLIVIVGLAWVTLYAFFPRKANNPPQPEPGKP